MKKQRANTFQERFGFADHDLKKPKHDEILLWLDDHALAIIKEIISWTDVWPAGAVEQKDKGVMDVLKNRADWLRDAIAERDKSASQPLDDDTTEKPWLKEYRERAKAEGERYRNELALIGTYQGLGDAPPPDVRTTPIWEEPVTHVGATKYVVGFLDMVVLVEKTELEVDGVYLQPPIRCEEIRRLPTRRLAWCETPEKRFGFEAKVAIPSLGELIRQLRHYQQYCRYQLYVVSPDDRFAGQLVAQGFGFIKYPDATIQKPAATRK